MAMMRAFVMTIALAALSIPTVFAQDREADLRLKYPYDTMAAQIPGLKVEDYETAIHLLAGMPDLVASVASLPIRPLAATPGAARQSSVVPLYNPPPLRPAVPPVPRITYPTTRGTYEWEAAHLRRSHR